MLNKGVVVYLLFIILIVVGCSKQNINDFNDIRQTTLDYIEGWYSGDVVRMERALHPNFIKRIFINPNTENGVLGEITKEQMLNRTKAGGGKLVPKDTYKIELSILDINNNVATVMTKSEYIDYLHLAKINNKWVIINVLWDFIKNK